MSAVDIKLQSYRQKLNTVPTRKQQETEQLYRLKKNIKLLPKSSKKCMYTYILLLLLLLL